MNEIAARTIAEAVKRAVIQENQRAVALHDINPNDDRWLRLIDPMFLPRVHDESDDSESHLRLV